MAKRLNMLSRPVEYRILHRGSRVFALLGKATSAGLTRFGAADVQRSWAVTAEYGCIRLERLTGDEEVTGLELFLPTAFSFDYGVTGVSASAELIRTVFGLLPSELEELVTILRRGSFPLLGFAEKDVKCCVNSGIIPAYWPHIVVSNLPLYGNVVSFEAFVRILVSSLPHGHSGIRYPGLVELAKEILKMMAVERPGVPYTRQMLNLMPAGAATATTPAQ